MRLMALDPASKMGWARHEDNSSEPVSGVAEFESRHFGTKAHSARSWLWGKIVANQVDLIVYEQMFVDRSGSSNDNTERWLRYLEGMIEEVCHALGVRVESVAAATWRKHFIGTGFAPKAIEKKRRRPWLKERVKERCRLLGWTPRDDNEADALGLLDYARCKHSPGMARIAAARDALTPQKVTPVVSDGPSLFPSGDAA